MHADFLSLWFLAGAASDSPSGTVLAFGDSDISFILQGSRSDTRDESDPCRLRFAFLGILCTYFRASLLPP